MNTRILFTIMLLLGLFVWSNGSAGQSATEQATIKVCIAPGMGNLAESWINGYHAINPEQQFELKQLSLSDVKANIGGNNTVGFVMQRPDRNMMAESMWHLTLGREIIVPVLNVSNPFMDAIKTEGISARELSEILLNQSTKWNAILSGGSEQQVRIILKDEPGVRLAVSKFFGLDPLVKFNLVSSDEEFVETIQRDVNCIGFCRLTTITDAESHDFIAQIGPLPFDRNGNGRIDNNENIFGKIDQFERAVWIGKYPRSLVYNIYAVSPNEPENEGVIDFLSWIVTSGQSAVLQNGYTDLAYYEKQVQLEKLHPGVLLASDEMSRDNNMATVLLIALFVMIVTVVTALVWNSKRKAKKVLYDNEETHKVLRPESIKIPNGLYYDKSHSWAFMEKEGTVKVGIDDFLQHVTGDYTGLIMKNPQEMIRRKEVAATLVHEGKKINILAPVSGRIIQANEDLMDYPSLVNNSPYTWGWLYEIQPSNWMREILFLQMADKYRDWIKKEFIQLKDFIIGSVQQKAPEGEFVLQEGGELPDHVLHDFEPHVWEEFQIRFIDNSDIN